MSILKAPPKQPKNSALQLRVDKELKIKLDKYAEFLDSTESYVVSSSRSGIEGSILTFGKSFA